MVGQENQQVRLADAKRYAGSNGTSTSQRCRSFPPPFYSAMADETTDSSNREQVVICLRRVDNSFNAHEELIGLQHVDRIYAATNTITIKYVIQRMDVRFTGATRQCYDG